MLVSEDKRINIKLVIMVDIDERLTVHLVYQEKCGDLLTAGKSEAGLEREDG